MNNQKNQNFPGERQAIDSNASMTNALDFARKDFQTTI